jgi:hypothetical protein
MGRRIVPYWSLLVGDASPAHARRAAELEVYLEVLDRLIVFGHGGLLRDGELNLRACLFPPPALLSEQLLDDVAVEHWTRG